MSEPDSTDAELIQKMLGEWFYHWEEAHNTTDYTAAEIGKVVAARLRAWVKDA